MRHRRLRPEICRPRVPAGHDHQGFVAAASRGEARARRRARRQGDRPQGCRPRLYVNTGVTESTDQVADALASFVGYAAHDLEPPTLQSAKFVLMDSFAVAIGALDHPAAKAARDYAGLFPVASGSSVWGTSVRTTPETATLVNGV